MLFEIDYYTIAVRLVLAAVLGGIIGWERERRNKQAGFRTHLLVAVGSALIMLTSGYGFAGLMNELNGQLGPSSGILVRFDPTRIAAQVVSGIGFLGAGAILRHSNVMVSGLTTAATLWVVAAIGLSVGSGFYFPAIATTVVALISVLMLRGVEVKYANTAKVRELKLVMEDSAGLLKEMNDILEEERIDISKVSFSDKVTEDGDRYMVTKFRIRFPAKKNMLTVVKQLQDLNGVKEVHYDKLSSK